MGHKFCVKICFCSSLHLFLPVPLSYIYNFVIIIVNFWRKNEECPGWPGHINLSSNKVKRELKATLITDWILNLPLTKHRDEILLLKRQNIRFYSDFWIHLRKLRDKIRTRLTYICAHLRSTKESLTDSVKKNFVRKFFCVKIFLGENLLGEHFLSEHFFWVNIFLSENFGWIFVGDIFLGEHFF